VPVHFLKRHRAKKRLGAMREFDGADLARTALDRELHNAEDPVGMPTAVGSVPLNLAGSLQSETLNQVCGKGKLRRSCINEGLAVNVLSSALFGKELILPVLQSDPDAEYTHDTPPVSS
jgi:hypothetical protein